MSDKMRLGLGILERENGWKLAKLGIKIASLPLEEASKIDCNME